MQETETKLISTIKSFFDTFPDDALHRAHRLGPFDPNKCRPIVAKFSHSKTREKVFALRDQFKQNNLTISEDFSVPTRAARKKLIEFGTSQPGSPNFKLRYNKLFLNNKCYIYDASTDSVRERAQSASGTLQNHSVPLRALQ